MKEAFSEKLETGNLWGFFIKSNLSKNHAAQIRNVIQSSSILIRISGPIPEKISALINIIVYCILGRNQAK